MTVASRYIVLAALAVATGCSSSSDGPTSSTNTVTNGGSATASSVDVNMPDVVFNPNHIDIAQNGVIRFIFTAVAHDVRFNGAAGAPADILVTTNATVSRTFATKGTFAVVCTLHSNMTATVVVH